MNRLAPLLLFALVGVARAEPSPASEWSKLKLPTKSAAQAIGGYSGGCLDGGVALPFTGTGFVVARPERNRVFGHPALIALIRGEAHAGMVQLALEYDPQPPFDSGSPAQAGPEIVAAYQRRVQALAPTRDEDLRALDRRRGYG